MKISGYIIGAAATVALSSCEKEIQFDYRDIPEQQVIEGLLTQDGISVRLTKTVPTDRPLDDSTVTDASVTLTDRTTGDTSILAPDTRGTFTLAGLAGHPGHQYELTVSIADDTYTAASRMLPPSEIVSAEFNWIRMPYDDVAVLKVQFTEDTDPTTGYWLRVYRNSEPYEWQTISSHNAVDGLVSGLMMTSRRDTDAEDDDTVLKDGDTIDIEVMPVARVKIGRAHV